MAQLIGRGATITLDARFEDHNGDLVVPDAVPQVDIIDANGTTVVNNAAPTRNPGTGRYEYDYAVDVAALLGAWEIQWSGVINGAALEQSEGFTVVPAGSIVTPTAAGGVTCSPWATSADALAPCNVYGIDETLLDQAMQVASDILYELTGRRWPGECTETIRPLAQHRAHDVPRWWPGDSRGSYGWCSCNRGRATGCARIPEIKLPGHPVDPASISVKIDGATFTDFDLHDGRYLVRNDEDGWPCCQNLLLDDTEDGTWSVTYGFGSGPPIGGALAAAMYGCQLALSLDPEAVNSGKCLLPKRVTTITRQGMTVAVLDPLTLVEKGLTGLALVDQWVASTRIGASRRRSTVIVPGGNRSARRIQ